MNWSRFRAMREAVRPPPQAREDETAFVQEHSFVTEHGQGAAAALALHVRWIDEYIPCRDVIETRVSASTRELPRRAYGQETNAARRQFFLRRYRGEYEKLVRRARERPGEIFHLAICISAEDIWLNVRPGTNVRETRDYVPLLLPQAYAPVPRTERERAEKRSMELLYDWLSDAQRKELAQEGYFTITGESSSKHYQVHKMHNFGLKELDDDGNVVTSFCVVPAGTHALGDIMLAQKIWMETDEETTLARANRMSALGLLAQYVARMAPDA